LLAPALFHDVGIWVFPSVDKGAVDRLLVREDIVKPLDDIAAAFLDHGGEDRRYVEDFRRFGEADNIVDDHRRLVAVQAGELVRLMVDQHEDAVFGRSSARLVLGIETPSVDLDIKTPLVTTLKRQWDREKHRERGYLGGAIATHVRVGSPLLSDTLFPIYVALLLWGGFYRRETQLRALVPFRR
jgi:hypothetical protein